MTFFSETQVKAVRKAHRCDGCGTAIEVGSPAVRWAGVTDGDFGAAVYHTDCRAAEVDLNQYILGHQHGDEWLPLSEIDDEDRVWLIGAYPAVARRMRFVAAPIALETEATPQSPSPREIA